MQSKLYEDYAELSRQKAHIEAKLDELKPLIMADMEKNKVDSFAQPFGTFSVRSTATYKYSEGITALEDMLSQAKEGERDSGKAQVEEKASLRFQAAKAKV